METADICGFLNKYNKKTKMDTNRRYNIKIILTREDLESNVSVEKIYGAISYYMKTSCNIILDFSTICKLVETEESPYFQNLNYFFYIFFNTFKPSILKDRVIFKKLSPSAKDKIMSMIKKLLELENKFYTDWKYVDFIYIIQTNNLIKQDPPVIEEENNKF